LEANRTMRWKRKGAFERGEKHTTETCVGAWVQPERGEEKPGAGLGSYAGAKRENAGQWNCVKGGGAVRRFYG